MAKSTVTNYRRTPCWGDPPIFRHDTDAVQWAVGQGAFVTVDAAGRALAELRAKHAAGIWARWITLVCQRVGARNHAR